MVLILLVVISPGVELLELDRPLVVEVVDEGLVVADVLDDLEQRLELALENADVEFVDLEVNLVDRLPRDAHRA